jgi:hypothetical protein
LGFSEIKRGRKGEGEIRRGRADFVISLRTLGLNNINNMNKTNLSLFFTVVLIISSCMNKEQNTNYRGNPEPLMQNAYIKLPLGAIKPEGWLRSSYWPRQQDFQAILTISGPNL